VERWSIIDIGADRGRDLPTALSTGSVPDPAASVDSTVTPRAQAPSPMDATGATPASKASVSAPADLTHLLNFPCNHRTALDDDRHLQRP
jgi:hypothetical protein